MSIKKWINLNTHDLTGKTIALTGTTGGLMTIVVDFLCSKNANLILLNRNKHLTEQQILKLKAKYPHINIEFVECNLENFESVKSATEVLKKRPIDILYLSAGAYNIKRSKTSLGFDNVFQINFVSHYYIAKQLLPFLNSRNGKIVAIGSVAHRYSKINSNDVDFSKQKKSSKVYGNAKRFLIFSLMKLLEHQPCKLAVVHPGVTLTSMTNHYPKAINWLVRIGIKLLFPSPKKASLSLFKGVFENTETHKWIGPSILNVWGYPKQQKLIIDTSEIDEIFAISEKIYNKINENFQHKK